MTLAPTYSNGFDMSKVVPALTRLGWIGETAPVSGRYYEDFHALVTSANLSATMPENRLLSEHKTALTRAAIMRCLSGVFREKEYLEQELIYDRADGSQNIEVDNTNLFVGYEISIPRNGAISVQLDSAVLHFNEAATFNLYVFKDGVNTPIWTKEVTTVANEQTIIPLDDLVLNYLGSVSKGSRFFFGYFQSELGTAKAIREEAVWNKTYCIAAIGMTSTATGLTFDQVNMTYPGEGYGLNFQVSSFKDHTAAIVSKAALFDEAIGLCVAYAVIEGVIYAVRSNATERILKDELDKVGIKLDLSGTAPISDSPRVKGLAQRIDEELKRLRLSFFPNHKAQTINLC